jgi:hypothetical protein
LSSPWQFFFNVSQRSLVGQPASTHSSTSLSFHRVDFPNRIDAGIRPLLFKRYKCAGEIARSRAISLASISNDSLITGVSIVIPDHALRSPRSVDQGPARGGGPGVASERFIGAIYASLSQSCPPGGLSATRVRYRGSGSLKNHFSNGRPDVFVTTLYARFRALN